MPSGAALPVAEAPEQPHLSGGSPAAVPVVTGPGPAVPVAAEPIVVPPQMTDSFNLFTALP